MPGENDKEIEKLVEEKVEERLQSLDAPTGENGGHRISRRAALTTIGGSVLGLGAGSALAADSDSVTIDASELRVDAVTADEVTGNVVDARDELHLNGDVYTTNDLGGSDGSGGSGGGGSPPDVRYAETAADIQPAIDALAEDIDTGGARGGVVQLGAKTYYPETTIFLKGGVTLQGVRRTRQTWSENTRDANDTMSTVISTAEMNEGPDAYPYEHDPGVPHPHFPVIAGYIAQPVENGTERTRDPTDYELTHWGNDIGLRNVIIRADKQRWWDWEKHGSGTIYDSERDATYFGVYDALIFEKVRGVLTENVETRNFLGYGGFWKDVPSAIDRGGRYEGGATDYHGTAYELNRDTDFMYTDGMWDFEARGPMPTVHFAGHVDNHFVSGGWSPHNKIIAEDHVFLGDEADYWNGDAPRADPEGASSILRQWDQRTHRLNGYWLTAGSGNPEYGIYDRNGNMSVRNTRISGANTGIQVQGGDIRLQNVRISNGTRGVRCAAFQPSVNGLRLKNLDYGFSFSGRANPEGTFDGVEFDGVTEAFENSNNKPVVFNYPSFLGCDAFGENFDDLVINTPSHYNDISDFPAEYE